MRVRVRVCVCVRARARVCYFCVAGYQAPRTYISLHDEGPSVCVCVCVCVAEALSSNTHSPHRPTRARVCVIFVCGRLSGLTTPLAQVEG